MSEEYTELSYVEGDDDFIKVVEKEDSDFMEFEKEEDGNVLVRTIQTQFPNAIGLKYKGSSGAWRAVREIDDALVPPKGGWGDRIYSLTFSGTTKRKVDSNDSGERDMKYSRPAVNRFLRDMAVVGLPYRSTEEEVKEYFEGKYGEVEHCHIKYDRETKKSRGFGFIRFKDEESAKSALHGEDYIEGRRVQVREKREKPMKMFVSGLPEGTTEEDVNKYFSKFGEIVDSYIPKPFRNFGFFTFGSVEDGKICLRERHTLDGAQLKVKPRLEKAPDGGAQGGGPPAGGFGDRSHSSFTSGYKPNYTPRNDQQRGRNMPSHHPPPYSGRNEKAEQLKNMLFDFLSNSN